MDEVQELAMTRRGAMIAAAGHGKTETIAKAVARYGGKRELILTHTHAGVSALRTRLARVGVEAKRVHVDTIAGWALRLATAFPRRSGLPTPTPRSNEEYSGVCGAVTSLLSSEPIRQILRASYSGVYVDEYQDCTVEQHAIIIRLSDILPCRIVGDPLQSIFDFGQNMLVRWDEDVRPSFVEVPGPSRAWRWEHNPSLGEWLADVREKLLAGHDVDLGTAPSSVRWLDGSQPSDKRKRQVNACFELVNLARGRSEMVVAIHQWPYQCRAVARQLGGQYSCVEAIDEGDLYEAAAQLDQSKGMARAVVVLEFAEKCVTKVGNELRAIRDALAKGRIPAVRKHKTYLDSLVALENAPIVEVLPVLRSLSQMGVVYRRELLREMERAITAVSVGEAASLAEAVWLVRDRTRRYGRHLWRHSVSTTPLVKGLQFDRAVVLDADALQNSRHLYVALTRATKSLTIVSRSRQIQHAPDAGTRSRSH